MDKITHTEIAQEVLLAEFSALRDEIIQLEQWQSNVFALQLTAVAAIFSFSLSSHSRTGFLLILPVLSYALTRRYLEIEAGIYRISDYIIEELSPKTNGGLGWEEWNRERMDSTSSQWPKITRWISPVPFVFPLTSIVALAWVAPYILFEPNMSDLNRSMLSIVWFVDLILSLLTLFIVRRPPILLFLTKHQGP